MESVRLEDGCCPLGCPRSDEVVVTGRDLLHDLPGEFTVVKCRKCGLMRTNPRPTRETIGAYYPSDYGPYQDTDPPIVPQGVGLKRWLKHILGFEIRAIPPTPVGRLLEIGCANGAYMEQMCHAGWSVEGIEFSETATQQARARGFSVQAATVETAQAPAQPVDIVAAWMVLEHLHEPVSALRKVRNWVKPDGYLIASVPDAGALERRVFGNRWYALQLPNHLYHFTPRSLERVLNCAGWKLERVRWQRNCNNLLWSIEYLARDKAWGRTANIVRWLRTSNGAAKFRILLRWILGMTRQSGRMEIWARPLLHASENTSA